MSKSRSGASKRMAAGLLAGSLAVFGLALASPAGAVEDVEVERLAGATRYGTAAAIAGEDPPGAFEGADTAILATGENFPDALAASGLAGANAPAPILLTRTAFLSEEALAALDQLAVANVIIVGGTAAVSDDAQDTLEDEGYTVSRVAGTNRYGTAAEIAGEVGAPADGTVLIATGTNYPDALAGGPLAYAGGHPILLVTPNDIPAETEAALADADNAIILGGTAAVSDAVQDEIDEITGGTSSRLAGVNRFETAEAVADYLLANEAGFDGTEVVLASGLNFPDALAGGPLGGELGAPIILTGSCPSADWLTEHSDTIEMIWALGGTAAQSDATLSECEAAAEDTSGNVNATATTRPELVSVTQQLLQTTNTATVAKPAGLYLVYTFDEAITGAGTNPAKFKVYQGDGTAVTATSTTIQTDGKSVVAYFAAYDTAAEVGLLTVATVDDDAVRGASGAATDANIEGDAPLAGGSTSSTPAAAGVTSAPDLTSVTNFRTAATADVTAVDFVFDEAAFVQNTAGFHLVTITGLVINCTGPAEDTTNASGGTIPGGEGTTTITVTCPDATDPTFSTTSIARAYVDAGTVDDTDAATGPTTPLESVDVANGGNSDSPDLVAVVFSPDALTGFDTVAYLFDEAIDAGPTSAGFGIYDTAGNQLNTGACSRSTESNSAVICLFADDTLKDATFIGGNVAASSVDEADGAKLNGGDEVGTTPSAGPAANTSGLTDGPDLTDAAIIATTSPFGNTTYSVKYTFDEDTADTASGDATQSGEEVVPALFHLVLSDGIRLDCASVAGSPVTTGTQTLTDRTEDNDNSVTCTAFVVAGTATAATPDQIHRAVVATVDAGAVDDEATTGATDDQNPEGAELTTGTSGTPAA